MDRKDSLLEFAGAVGDANESIDASSMAQQQQQQQQQHRQQVAVADGGGGSPRKLIPTRQTKQQPPVRRETSEGTCHPANNNNGHRHVHWNNTIEVYTFPFDYTPEEIRKTWWQNPEDFNEMKMVMMFIGKASLDENVRRWFENHYREQHSKKESKTSHEGKYGVHVVNEYIYDSDEEEDEDESCCSGNCFFLPSWCAPRSSGNKGDSLVPRPNLPARKIRRGSVARVADDKWWHQYGHSRRGVENIGTAEGLERLRRITETRRLVVAEYRRQLMMGRYDPVQLSLYYQKLSLWARNLAIAAGESDADAVEKDFDDKGRHSREFYLMKKLLTKDIPANEAEHLPTFMKPPGGIPAMKSGVDGGTGKNETVPIPREPQRAGRTVEALKDAPEKRSNLAKQASGLGSGDASMGAVLSGMGNSSKKIPLEEENTGHEGADIESRPNRSRVTII